MTDNPIPSGPDDCVKLVATLRPHSSCAGVWVGMLGDRAIALHETDGGGFALFYNPGATRLLNTIQVEVR